MTLSIPRNKINNCLRRRQKTKRHVMMLDAIWREPCRRSDCDNDDKGGSALGRMSSGGRALSRWPKCGRATEPPCRRLGPFGLRSLPRLCRTVRARPRRACAYSRSLPCPLIASLRADRGHPRFRPIVSAHPLSSQPPTSPLPVLATSVVDCLGPGRSCHLRWNGRPYLT